MLTALGGWDPVVGLVVVGSYQGCSEALETLAREAADRGDGAQRDWKKMGARSEDEALGIFMHSVRRRWLGQRDVRWKRRCRHAAPLWEAGSALKIAGSAFQSKLWPGPTYGARAKKKFGPSGDKMGSGAG